MFGNQQQEQGFLVRGGMAWYKNILIAACEVLNAPVAGKLYEVYICIMMSDNNECTHA